MVDTERRIITVSRDDALLHVGAIEGLLFDSQPHLEFSAPEKKTLYGWIKSKITRPDAESLFNPVPDPTLAHRYKSLISRRFYEMTQGVGETNPEVSDRKFVYGSKYFTKNERPSLLVDAGFIRRYIINLQLVQDSTLLFVASHLNLRYLEDRLETDLLFFGPYMLQLNNEGAESMAFIPSFEDQQRLLEVDTILRKYLEPTQPSL